MYYCSCLLLSQSPLIGILRQFSHHQSFRNTFWFFFTILAINGLTSKSLFVLSVVMDSISTTLSQSWHAATLPEYHKLQHWMNKLLQEHRLVLHSTLQSQTNVFIKSSGNGTLSVLLVSRRFLSCTICNPNQFYSCQCSTGKIGKTFTSSDVFRRQPLEAFESKLS